MIKEWNRCRLDRVRYGIRKFIPYLILRFSYTDIKHGIKFTTGNILLVICSLIFYNSSIITRLAKEVHLMSIQNAGKTIRDARMRAGLTQEQNCKLTGESIRSGETGGAGKK